MPSRAEAVARRDAARAGRRHSVGGEQPIRMAAGQICRGRGDAMTAGCMGDEVGELHQLRSEQLSGDGCDDSKSAVGSDGIWRLRDARPLGLERASGEVAAAPATGVSPRGSIQKGIGRRESAALIFQGLLRGHERLERGSARGARAETRCGCGLHRSFGCARRKLNQETPN